MRFKKCIDGDKKIITKFAILPITIGRETRWLEKVTYEVQKNDRLNMWGLVRFIDKDEK